MLLRTLVAGVVSFTFGCHRPTSIPADASSGASTAVDEPTTKSSCALSLAEERAAWTVVSDAELLALLVPGYDPKTGSAPMTRWDAKEGDAILAGLSSTDGVRDCAGHIHPALRPAADAPSRASVAVSTRTVLSRDRLAVWIVTGQDGGFCAPGLGFVALVTRRGRDIVGTTTPLRLACLDVPKRFELLKLGSAELLLVEDGSGTEHGGRQLFHALAVGTAGLERTGTFDGSGQEGLPRDGSVRKIDSTHVVRGEEVVVTDAWTDESCKHDAKKSDTFTCTLTARGRVEKRLALRDGKLASRVDAGSEQAP